LEVFDYRRLINDSVSHTRLTTGAFYTSPTKSVLYGTDHQRKPQIHPMLFIPKKYKTLLPTRSLNFNKLKDIKLYIKKKKKKKLKKIENSIIKKKTITKKKKNIHRIKT